MKSIPRCYLAFPIFLMVAGATARAHDPVFGPGPHTLYQGGTEVHLELLRMDMEDETEDELTLALKYGLSGDWVVGIELPYRRQGTPTNNSRGLGNATVSTKYRFWREDKLGQQSSAALLVGIKMDTGASAATSNDTSGLFGVTYGFESLTWYRWASIRYLTHGTQQGLQRGDQWFVDLALGYRPKINDYRAPDWVWMVELNGAYRDKHRQSGVVLDNTGGRQWFVAPGLMWTVRNFAIKGGVQIPIMHDLNGIQAKADYRARLEFEWHL